MTKKSQNYEKKDSAKIFFNTILSLIKLKKFFFDSSPKKAKKAKIRSRKKVRSSILVKPQKGQKRPKKVRHFPKDYL